MDAITHLLVGRILATGLGGALGTLATVFAVLPDADTLVWAAPPLRKWLTHRGATHSLVFGVAASALAGLLFWLAGWSSFGLAFLVALAGFLTHVALDVLNWGCLLLWPFSRRPVERTVHAGFAWSAGLSVAGLVALEGVGAWMPWLKPWLAAGFAAFLVGHMALRLVLRHLAGRRHPGRILVPTGNPFRWLAVVEPRVRSPEGGLAVEPVSVFGASA